MKIKTSVVPGFTLLELMIATVLGSILLLSASAMFMTMMIGNATTNARRQMSAEGTQMLGTLEYHIRNAKSAVVGSVAGDGTCIGNTGTYLTLSNLQGPPMSACFTKSPPGTNIDKLSFDRTSATCINLVENKLNSTFVVIKDPTPKFTCTKAANGKQTIKIDFTLGTSEDASITAPFSSIVQLRNS